MIQADGKVEAEEIAVAEAIGKKLHDKFSSKRFRSLVQEEHLTKDPKRLARDAGDILGVEGKRSVLIYLQHIALADGEMHPKEKKLLTKIAKEWGLQPPESPEVDTSIGVEDIMYALAASVITADGIVEDDEVAVASAIGQHLFENFSMDELAAVCSNKNQVPEPKKLALMINDHITDEGKEVIVKFLDAIATAANESNREGIAAVSEISKVWGIS